MDRLTDRWVKIIISSTPCCVGYKYISKISKSRFQYCFKTMQIILIKQVYYSVIEKQPIYTPNLLWPIFCLEAQTPVVSWQLMWLELLQASPVWVLFGGQRPWRVWGLAEGLDFCESSCHLLPFSNLEIFRKILIITLKKINLSINTWTHFIKRNIFHA